MGRHVEKIKEAHALLGKSTFGRHVRIVMYVRLLLVLFLAGLLIGVAYAGQAKAIDVPGVEVCPKEAPFANTPDSGVAGLLGERPLKITTDNSPEHIWSTGGFAGLKAHTYDLGCAMNPASWTKITNANAGSGFSNTVMSVGDAVVSLTDSLDRRAWTPTWIQSFLNGLAKEVTGRASNVLLIPYLGAALALVTLVLVWRAKDGNLSLQYHGVGWACFVIVITSLLLMMPLLTSQTASSVGNTGVAILNGGSEASDAVTNQVVKNVQYQGWLRRNFGDDGATAKKYGPDLLASTRVSWAELEAIEAKPAGEQSKAREDLSDKKAEQFKKIAAKIEKEDPTAYRHLKGEIQVGPLETIIETIAVVFACIIRIALDLLMILCVMALAVLAMAWVVLTPAIIQPTIGKFDGHRMGMELINNSTRAFWFVAQAALGSWLFGLWLQACMAPGMNLWWSLTLIIFGTFFAFLLIAPIKKAKSILTLGKYDHVSFIGKTVGTALKGYAPALLAAVKVNRDAKDRDEEKEERLSENRPQPEVVHAEIFNPGESPAMWSESQYTAYADRTLPMGSPKPLPYERGEPEPPKGGAQSPYRPYERSDDNEGAMT